MREILGKAKTVRELLKGVKYSIDYYQREYKWHEKQIRELVDDLTYEEKLPHYNTQNLLARSLHTQCYKHNPGFLRLKEQQNLPFMPLAQFKKADLETRSLLYRQIAERTWNPDDLLKRDA